MLQKQIAWLASPFRSSLVLILLTCAVYWPVTTHDFVRWDDQINVYENPHLNPPSWQDVKHFWTSSKQETTQPNLPVMYVYRPVVYTVWAAVAKFATLSTPMQSNEAETYHLNPHIFHATNLIFHLLNSLLMLALLRHICRDSLAAFLGATLFALHPVQVEAVAWVTGLNDLLYTFFSLSAVRLYICFAEHTSRSRWRFYALAIVCFVLALLSKPAAVIVPLMLLVIECAFLKRSWKQSTRALCPWLIPAIGMLIITKMAEPESGRIFSPLWARPLIALDAIAFYLSKILYPVWLGPDYGRTPKTILQNGWAYLTWIGPVLLFVTAWLLRRRHEWFLASLTLLTIGLLPVLGLVPFRYQNHSTVADRYLYLPFLGVALLTAYGLITIRQRRAPLYISGLLTIVLLICLGLSARQVRFWENTATLFAHVRAVHPTSWVAHANYGSYLLHVKRFDEAAKSFELALREDPDYFQLKTDYAYALALQGKYNQAKDAYQQALQERPDSIVALAGLGNVLDRQGHIDEAITAYQRVLKLDPESADALYNLGHALYRKGDLQSAIRVLGDALNLEPDDAQTHNALALALVKTGESTLAAWHWEKAVQLDPQFAEAHVNLGVLLAQQRQLDQALLHWKTALRADPKNAEAHYYTGLVLANEGKTAEAIRHWTEALRLKPDYEAARTALNQFQKRH